MNPRALFFFLISIVVLLAALPVYYFDQSDRKLYLINWISHGTCLGNLFSVIIYAFAGYSIAKGKTFSEKYDFMRGAATLYLTTILFSYATFLMSRPYYQNGYFDWRDFTLHLANPFIMICWWLIFPPQKPVSAVKSLIWLIPGAAYLAYILIRGAIINWYPYTVLYPSPDQGWVSVFKVIISAAIFFVLMAQLVAWTSRINKS